MNNSSTLVIESKILARRVPQEARLPILPQHFGRYALAFESAVYVFAHQLCADYGGGYWHFTELDNGGFYMAPQWGPMRVSVEGNGFAGDLSADAAGITMCLFACSHLSYKFSDPTFARHYHLLRDFAFEHAERRLISAAID